MNEIKVFTNEEFGSVRTVVEKDTLWFCGKDVLTALEYKEGSNPAKAFQAVPDEWKGVKPIHTHGGEQNMLFLTEQGLYFFLGRSDKPKSIPYQKYVAGKVVPSIRKYGVYATGDFLQKSISDPDYAISILQALKKEREEKEGLLEENAVQKQLIAEMKPKVTYCQIVLECQDAISISKIAKDYGWSANKMNDYLHDKGVQYKQGDTWLLYQKYANYGYTKSETVVYGNGGNMHPKIHTKWTQSGRLFIYNLLKTDGIFPMVERDNLKMGDVQTRLEGM